MPDPVQQAASDETQLRLSDYTRPIVDRLLLIVATVIVVTVATYVYYDRQPAVYQASTSIYLTTPDTNLITGNGFGVDDRTTLSQATLLTTRAVAARVARQLGYAGGPDPLRAAVTAAPSTGSDFIAVSAKWGTGQGAADIANAFATEFIRTRSDQQRAVARRLLTRLQNQLDDVSTSAVDQTDRGTLRSQVRQLQLSLQLPSSGAEQVDAATDPGVALAPRPKRNAVFAALLALLAAVGLAYGLDRFDRRLRRAGDLPEVYDLPLLSVVPHVSQFGRGGAAPAGFVEAFRLLQTNLRLTQTDRNIRVVLVTSAIPGEGKSTVVRYLAEAFSEWGRTVAVIDADLRRPSLTRLYGVTGAEGLTDLVAADSLNGSVAQSLVEVGRPRVGGSGADGDVPQDPGTAGEVEEPEVAVGSVAVMATARNGTALPGSQRAPIYVLPSGTAPPNPAALLAAGRTKELVATISASHDVVIIDTPPVLAVSDAMALVPIADAVLLVSRVGKTTRDEAQRLVEMLRRIPEARLTGVVANDELPADGDRYDYYSA